MPTTSNFGWTTPADTDLVKDGAAAIRTLGNGIDSSMAQLKGGTTGQVLSKTSATDMAFTWTTPQVGDITSVNAGTGISGGGTTGDVTITNSMATTIDAKGDLIVGTADNAFSRLAVGTNNQVLIADSATSTGLKWGTLSSGGYTLLSTTGITGGTVSVTNIPTTYTELIIVLSDFDAGTDNSTMTFTLNNDSSGSYVFNRIVTALASSGNTTGATSVTINTNLDQAFGPSNANVVLRLFRYGTTDAFKSGEFYGIWPHNDGWWYPLLGSFGYKSSSAVSRFDLTCNNSGFSANGNIYVYGAN